jgi:hypothetical protein
MVNGSTKDILDRQKNKRPNKKVTFAEWVTMRGKKSYKNKDKYECPDCWGRGGHHEFAYRDIIEGYKGVKPKYPCYTCNSRGWVETEDLRPYYNFYVEIWKEDYEEWKEETRILKSIVSSLNDEQIEYLLKNGGL